MNACNRNNMGSAASLTASQEPAGNPVIHECSATHFIMLYAQSCGFTVKEIVTLLAISFEVAIYEFIPAKSSSAVCPLQNYLTETLTEFAEKPKKLI